MTIVYRVIAAAAYRERPLVRVMAEEVPAAELRYVVPFEARSRYVGADYVEQLARVRGGTYRRNPPDVGILASLDSLDGPTFDASLVHPLIREFYEHTSRFKLSIVPEWRRWMKPAYEIFKRVVAEPLGQAAIPSNIEEAQRGMVSTIDTIDLDDDEVIDIRGWIRTFADSGKPIYVGIYTSFRHDGRGYVSVGFPIPSANFTATLLPRNVGGGRPPAHLEDRPPVPGPLPQLGRRRARRADGAQAARVRGARSTCTSTTASCAPSTASRSPAGGSSRCTTRSSASRRRPDGAGRRGRASA